LSIPDCWIEGVVPLEKDGWYLVRHDHLGNIGVVLYDVVTDPKLRKMVYLDHVLGYTALGLENDYSRGKVTHHCEPTAANFFAAFRELRDIKAGTVGEESG